MIVITGATGNTGKPAAEALLAKGERVRVIGRRAIHLDPLTRKGAEPFFGNVEDAASMTKAFEGATAVYLAIPGALQREDFRAYEEGVSDAYAAAITNARVPYAVTLSSVGAQHAKGTGPILGLHNMEQKLNRIPGLHVLHLRPAQFMENLLMNIGAVRSMGVLPGPAPEGVPMPWIAARDIGNYAAERLAARNFSGSSTQELLGPREYTAKEVAAIVGKAIGKPDLAYVQAQLAAIESALVATGMPKSSAGMLIEMMEGGGKGLLNPQEPRSAKNTTPTTLEWFASEVFAPAFSRKTASA
jgi:uncharacterized protein YbjT (DUF2867 family)